MDLIRITNADLAYGTTPLLKDAEFKIAKGERVCIVGRNGTGKSTLLKVINKDVALDSGEINRVKDLTVARLEQDPPKSAQGLVFDYVAEGLPEAAELLKRYHHINDLIVNDPSEQNLKKLERVQHELDVADAWKLESRIKLVLTRLGLNLESQLESLSGGWLRKVALARALVCDPDILLLDEPTNHLDVASVEWLESFLKDFKGAILFISHDRAFIRALATRIVDLDRGIVKSYPGNYETYLEQKEEWLKVEEQHNAAFDKVLAQEETWIRQGIKARRTRNEGRVRALKQLRFERSQRIERQGTTDFNIETAQKSGKLVFEATNVSFKYNDKTLFSDFSTLVMRGDKIGILGPNGVGKTTLIKVLLGDLAPTSGKVKQGVNLDVAYFDQYRNQLDEELSVQENVGEGKQEVMVNGRSRHILGYLQDFLFSPLRARTPVKALSGGEKNRLLLAKLFLKPSNVLILDEPTNDLDVETLELLEDILDSYDGTVLIVSHDREFINNTVTNTYCFEPDGNLVEIVGGYEDYLRYSEHKKFHTGSSKEKLTESNQENTKPVNKEIKGSAPKQKKLSYKLKLELESLPAEIEQLENKIEALQQDVNDPEFFKQSSEETQAKLNELAESESKLEFAYGRWEELEDLQNSSS
ncbi:ATP-binding cassette ATPase Uup [Flocculibacter collagenilyticus]|uniref:ATP-binding cassette ATPase Uup n=1 Tax=Flocculibacter collagenilyticus TaxID=2744479 RepID=UPI0018F638E3|nr:ABC transporter ATP-binding protein [Flocculibacter collagenilyticus]